MADVDDISPNVNVFWTKEDKDSDDGRESYVPGVDLVGNRRPLRMKGKRTQEIKVKIPVKQSLIVEDLTPSSSSTVLESYEESRRPHNHHGHGTTKASLKDLCADDKKRVANLIKELARMGDEREKAVGQLHNERTQFEKQVLTLVEQQDQILQEREDIQRNLFQCQELIKQYQDAILEKEQKLNSSVSKAKKKPTVVNMSPRYFVEDRRLSSSPKSVEQNKENIPDLYHNHEYVNTKSSSYKPYTSQIDREIAYRKSTEDIPSAITVDDKYRYPATTVPSLGPFREPIMSSTQKSTEIHKYIPNDDEFQPLIPSQSPRSSRVSAQELTPPEFAKETEQSIKVGFKDKLELSDTEARIYSPNLPIPQSLFGDKDYMEYYRKLNSNERKRELLKQRQNLLKEQDRLKDILVQQEHKLNKKKEQLMTQQRLQKERLDYFEQNGKFPLRKQEVRDDYENVRSREDSIFDGEIEKLDLDRTVSDTEDIDKEKDASLNMRSKVSAATSPISKLQFSSHSIATSPIRMEQSKAIQHTPPRGMDVATSISYHSTRPRSPASPGILDTTLERQGNLPMTSNRQRTPALSPSTKVEKKPGDKTMSIVEIVNSLEESPSLKSSVKGRNSNPLWTNLSPFKQNTSIEEDEDLTQEESEILEDIFFLK